eukprot:1195722-Prorocentrum_minimum.AAC.2
MLYTQRNGWLTRPKRFSVPPAPVGVHTNTCVRLVCRENIPAPYASDWSVMRRAALGGRTGAPDGCRGAPPRLRLRDALRLL